MVRMNPLLSMRRTQQTEEITHELTRVIRYVSRRIFADYHHLSDVGFCLDVAFESVFVATLFFANLAVPS